MAFKYKVKTTDSWSTIAKGVGSTVQQLMKANPGTTSLSTGMGIQLPAYNLPSNPVSPYVLPGNPVGNTPANAGISALPPYGQSAPTLNATGFTDMTDQRNSGVVTNSTNIGTGDARYSQNSNPYTPNVVWMYDANGQPVMNQDGSQASRPRYVIASDIPALAAAQGIDPLAYSQNMQSNGYVLYGGTWVYQGTPQAAQSARPARLANGNLVRRRGENDLTYIERKSGKLNEEHQKRYDERFGSGNGNIGTSSSNFGVGTG